MEEKDSQGMPSGNHLTKMPEYLNIMFVWPTKEHRRIMIRFSQNKIQLIFTFYSQLVPLIGKYVP